MPSQFVGSWHAGEVANVHGGMIYGVKWKWIGETLRGIRCQTDKTVDWRRPSCWFAGELNQ